MSVSPDLPLVQACHNNYRFISRPIVVYSPFFSAVPDVTAYMPENVSGQRRPSVKCMAVLHLYAEVQHPCSEASTYRYTHIVCMKALHCWLLLYNLHCLRRCGVFSTLRLFLRVYVAHVIEFDSHCGTCSNMLLVCCIDEIPFAMFHDHISPAYLICFAIHYALAEAALF